MVKAVPEQPQQKKKAQKRSSMPRGYIVRHLDEAIEKKWIKVYYQPIVRTISRELCAMEALARWDDPTYGFLTPPQFIGVLEQHNLIDKLDRYMIEAVCRNFARLRKAGRQAVPISLNLSRLDFITCDIFAVVEETLRRFDVPRDMLHLEVVESILTDRVKVIGTSLDKFRNAGYEIWMDDFGSGYSTLNFLKDQRFDVLKMDMAFLKSDTQRARDIILSIIAMDKRIGNRTLAEGVETEEQFHFLRESGCEKVQGYYLGRPMPYDKSVEECLTQGIGIEERNWKSYYDAIARVDFLAEQPLMLLEYREGSYQLLFANERCAKMLWDSAPDGAARWAQAFNRAHDLDLHYLQNGLLRIAQTGEPEDFSYARDNTIIRLEVSLVVKREQRALFEVRCRSKLKFREEEQMRPELIQKAIFYRYDAIMTLNVKSRQILLLSSPSSKSNHCCFAFADALAFYKKEYVYEADQQRCDTFFAWDDLAARLDASENGILCSIFRVKWRGHSLVWKSHTIMRVPHLKDEVYLCLIRNADVQQLEDDPVACETMRYDKAPVMTPGIVGSARAEQTEGSSQRLLLWNNFVENFPLPVFWKNKDRQFVGVNQAFLDFYGFDSAQELLAQDDEDMHWHVQGEDFRRHELSVIQEDKSYHQMQGSCIARGVLHDILATKWPLYDDAGRNVGLMGYFVPSECSKAAEKQVEAGHSFTDTVTKLPDMRGIICLMERYLDEYRLYDHPFVMLFCHIPELVRLQRTYGEESCKTLLVEIARAIVGVVKQCGVVGRLDTDTFIVLCRYDQQKEAETLSHAVREAVEAIHRFGPYTCTLFARLEAEYPSEEGDFYAKVIRHLK